MQRLLHPVPEQEDTWKGLWYQCTVVMVRHYRPYLFKAAPMSGAMDEFIIARTVKSAPMSAAISR